MRYLIVILLLFCCGVIHAGNGIPVSKIDCEAVGTELSFAFKLWQENRIKQAMDEIESKLKSDSALLSQAAIITGGIISLLTGQADFHRREPGWSIRRTPLQYVLMMAYSTGLIKEIRASLITISKQAKKPLSIPEVLMPSSLVFSRIPAFFILQAKDQTLTSPLKRLYFCTISTMEPLPSVFRLTHKNFALMVIKQFSMTCRKALLL